MMIVKRKSYSWVVLVLAIGALAILMALCNIGRHPAASSAASQAQSAPRIIVDHTSVALFDRIPEEFISAAASWRVVWWNKSVGALLDDGLTKLMQADPRFNRANWKYFMWPATGCGGWYDLMGCFYAQAGPVLDQYELLSYQTSYLEVGLGSTVMRYFDDTAALNEIGDYTLWQEDRGRRAMYWTSSLSRDAGSAESTAFNATMREYVRLHGGILFDMADILSFTPSGQPCYDNRDGVYYSQPGTNPPKEENYPDDGHNYPAICGNDVYTVETFGGHLNRAAKERLAKAYWVLMAKVAGWIPEGEPPEPSATPAATATSVLQSPLPTPTDQPTRTPTLAPEETITYVTPVILTDTPEPPTATPVPAPAQPTVTPTFIPTATPTPTATPPVVCPFDGRTSATVGAALQLWLEVWPMAERYRDAANGSGSIEPLTPAEVSALITACWTRANVTGAGYYRGDR